MNFYIKESRLKKMIFILAGLAVQSTALASQPANYNSTSNIAGTSSASTHPVEAKQQGSLYKDDSLFSRFKPKQATIVFQAGGFSASEGEAQNINIQDLVGDRFTVTNHYRQNILLGLGYFIHGLDKDQFSLMYGLNAFYLAHTSVQGDVVQELLFTNLSYRYSLTHYPIYLAAKALFNTPNENYTITLDVGVGPNIINSSNFSETSIDGVTLPDRAFTGRTSVAFSATAGFGLKFNNVFGHSPLEIGYRFFYLGPSYLSIANSQIINTLKTGNNYANALVLSVSI